MSEIYLGNGSNLTIQTSKNVKLKETLSLMVENGKFIDLDVEIIANFENIPAQYQEVFINMMTSRYYNKTSFGDNPFSKCTPPIIKKWWQFWK